VEDLLGVGRATKRKLHCYGIKTIGELANTDPDMLQRWFGKWGIILSSFANGLDNSPVDATNNHKDISVGNSTTTPRDLENEHDCWLVFLNLAESVAERVRNLGYKGKVIEISLRDNSLSGFIRQRTLPAPTNIAIEMAEMAMVLLRQHYAWEKPLRSIGIRCTGFAPDDTPEQLSVFEDNVRREKIEIIEREIDNIRHRFGHYSIGRASLILDKSLGWINPIADHTIHPIGYF